jgi:hypothetical protein
MLGYTVEQVEDMCKTLNYSLHHHLPNVAGPSSRFVEEDVVVLKQIEDLLLGLLAEGHVQ